MPEHRLSAQQEHQSNLRIMDPSSEALWASDLSYGRRTIPEMYQEWAGLWTKVRLVLPVGASEEIAADHQSRKGPSMFTHLTTQELDAARAKYRGEIIPAGALSVMDAETEALRGSGIERQALKPGAVAPDFMLPDAQGRCVRLQSWASPVRLQSRPLSLPERIASSGSTGVAP